MSDIFRWFLCVIVLFFGNVVFASVRTWVNSQAPTPIDVFAWSWVLVLIVIIEVLFVRLVIVKQK